MKETLHCTGTLTSAAEIPVRDVTTIVLDILEHCYALNVVNKITITITTPGWTPLHSAAESGHCRVVELLLARGANPTLLTDTGTWYSVIRTQGRSHQKKQKKLGL